MNDDKRKAAARAAIQHVYVVTCDGCGEVIEDATFDFESEAFEEAEANLRADGRVLCDHCADPKWQARLAKVAKAAEAARDLTEGTP